MKNYQFRTNWCGQIILQRLHSQPTGYFGDRKYFYEDADVGDLKHYYLQLHNLQNSATNSQRELFESECG